MIALSRLPIRIGPSLIAEKSGCPKIAPMIGVETSLASELTTAPKAAPIITPTARSIALPRRINSRKPLSIGITLPFCLIFAGGRSLGALCRCKLRSAETAGMPTHPQLGVDVYQQLAKRQTCPA